MPRAHLFVLGPSMVMDREIIPIEGTSDLVIQVTDDGSRTLIDVPLGVSFHSASGAATETRHVYLDNSGVSEKLRQKESLGVLEVGLGTAMGLLMTVDLAVEHQAGLFYRGFDRRLLHWEILEELKLHRHLRHPWLVDQFLDWRRSLGDLVADGDYPWSFKLDDQCQKPIEVVITVGEFNPSELLDSDPFDAIYFDPFAPAATPELWSVEVLQVLRDQLAVSGRLTTYCVSREVREKFSEAGFFVQRVRGPKGGKREVLIASRLAELGPSL